MNEGPDETGRSTAHHAETVTTPATHRSHIGKINTAWDEDPSTPRTRTSNKLGVVHAAERDARVAETSHAQRRISELEDELTATRESLRRVIRQANQ